MNASSSDVEVVTKGNSPYEGWGTALKPAHEPIVVARKPLSEKTIAKNVLEWGTGGINIDECRVGTEERSFNSKGIRPGANNMIGDKGFEGQGTKEVQGRFPANFIHDGSDEVVGLFPDTKGATSRTPSNKVGVTNFGAGNNLEIYKDNSISASRFFYCAKASKKDRNEGLEELEEKEVRGGGGRANSGYDETDEEQKRLKDSAQAFGAVKAKKANTHPTVKPTTLMQYLVRLVTPVGGTVLDPFMGSGSTGKACALEGFNFIGIDLDHDYVKIAEARIKAVMK